MKDFWLSGLKRSPIIRLENKVVGEGIGKYNYKDSILGWQMLSSGVCEGQKKEKKHCSSLCT